VCFRGQRVRIRRGPATARSKGRTHSAVVKESWGRSLLLGSVRTEKLVFSCNYRRLGNRANVAGTGTSLCRVVVGEWQMDRGRARLMKEMSCIPYRSNVRMFFTDCVGQQVREHRRVGGVEVSLLAPGLPLTVKDNLAHTNGD
jgi:hypothetical protein